MVLAIFLSFPNFLRSRSFWHTIDWDFGFNWIPEKQHIYFGNRCLASSSSNSYLHLLLDTKKAHLFRCFLRVSNSQSFAPNPYKPQREAKRRENQLGTVVWPTSSN